MIEIVIFSLLFCLILLFNSNTSEKYDYDRENPNALVSGCSVAGTVYSSYPNQTPGLGWIL